ncbi:hypothetical protein H5407_20670 [Mitsuaria sp. WAJ17]|uniref:hypothetical protein n=1 Tax=Mitsuaria sp. WAJ17 TaxID=2761452 RepID=UPI0015FECE15|nr:hypothetical protein [Mitsuaria sp. WAJ17]MBB2487657.1 hypothetical protein [Mitsuaria sp. WAJ17]
MPQRILQRAAGGALLSGLLLVLRGRHDDGDGAVPLNTISHWVWPDSAFHARGLSVRHTATGALIHFGASCFWSVIFEGRRLLRPARAPEPSVREVLRDALALSAAAAWVDLALVPPALSPGFERRLSGSSLCRVYLAFAAGLALGELWPAAARPQRPARRLSGPHPSAPAAPLLDEQRAA